MELIERVARAIHASADNPFSNFEFMQEMREAQAKAAIRAMLDGVEPVAVLRFNHDLTSEHNEMPKVISCIWQPDGEHMVYSLDALKEAL